MKGSESSQVLVAEVWIENPSGGSLPAEGAAAAAVSAGPGLLAPGPPGQAVAAGLSERAASDRPLAAPLTICPRTTRSKSCAGHSLPSGTGLLEGGESPLPRPGAPVPGSARRGSGGRLAPQVASRLLAPGSNLVGVAPGRAGRAAARGPGWCQVGAGTGDLSKLRPAAGCRRPPPPAGPTCGRGAPAALIELEEEIEVELRVLLQPRHVGVARHWCAKRSRASPA